MMRLDKFLKVSRLIKRRTLAKEVCDQGRVLINGRTAKAGSAVAVGDQITIRFGHKQVTVRVDSLAESPRKQEAGSMYTLLEEKVLEDSEEAGTPL
ncbi:Ribosomal 50S subunit-recycling heat shock protein, contains S4 domain [Planifilum fulgidum]|jgi:ribosomal 50S subunit-recycling heat shock protein|uniref:RQC P-site tRNA stabilizing factor n=2 Tax=Planifilum fulgidum TaxID=201973 RepID=A0A1I2PUM8_9BACL|nr:Ribosomal 50S subunit-recycling heat shock protein, contains S4 domain [Planifilum fulgidum]